MRHIEAVRHREPPLLVSLAWQATQVSLRSDVFSVQSVTIAIRKDIVHLARVLSVRIGSDNVSAVACILIF